MKSLHAIGAICSLLIVTSSCHHGDNSNDLATLFPDSIVQQSRTDLQTKCDYLKIDNPLDVYDAEGNKSVLSGVERAAMTFIYAYMVTPDMLDYSTDFHLANVRTSLKARSQMPWGKEVPAALFRHFVLPLRINNEAIDSVRLKLYDELKPVVEGKTMEEAVLALNHWCHRYVTYQPSDARTSSPLATMRNALGRCGEESTFTVAVLRTMGIPARQVYTPRWAHTDDNHAWVEAWVDGKWHYLGACEPAPVLDHAWFDAPVLRAMMLDTKVFGHYRGDDEILSEHPTYTVINVTPGYVPTDVAKVRVVHADGSPAVGVPVTFRLYNYAELYPLATRDTDAQGVASVRLGRGDIVIIAGDSPDRMGIMKYTVGDPGNDPNGVELKLSSYDDWADDMHFTLVPPIARKPEVFDDSVAINACNEKMMEEDSVRTAYTETFPTEAEAMALASQLGIDGDPTLTDILKTRYVESRGNHQAIRDYLTGLTPDQVTFGIRMLGSLTTKDMHDITVEALRSYTPYNPSAFRPHIDEPRVAYEKIWPLQPFVRDMIIHRVGDLVNNPRPSRADMVKGIVTMMNEDYRLDDDYNPIHQPLSAKALVDYRVGDVMSLQIQLIRACRLMDVPAVWDETIGMPVYFDESGARVIIEYPGKEEVSEHRTSQDLHLTYSPQGYLKMPRYYTNFTIGYLDQSGTYASYEFGDNVPYTDSSLKSADLIYDHNFISTGTRMADGTVLMAVRKIKKGGATPILFDQDPTQVSVIGHMNPEATYYNLKQESETSILATTGRGYFVLVIGKSHHEPTDHILRDMNILKGKDGQPVIPIVAMTEGSDAPSDALTALLPIAHWGIDRESHMIPMLQTGCQMTGAPTLPVVAICDTFGRIVFISEGYTIGIGERVFGVIADVTQEGK